MASPSKNSTKPAGLEIAEHLAPRLLTIPQAAAYCSAAIWAIRQAIINKELRACIIGRRFLIDRAALDAFIDRKMNEAAA